MKKITTNGDTIEFRVDGATVLKITKEGCLATPEQAAIVADRLGGNVTVVDTTLEEVVEEIVAPVEEEVTVPEEQVVVEDQIDTVEEEVSAPAAKKGKGSKK